MYSGKTFIGGIFFLPIVFFLGVISASFAQLSKTHYIPPLTSGYSNNSYFNRQYLYISTPATTNVSVTIIPIGSPPSNYIYTSVSNSSPFRLDIDPDGSLETGSQLYLSNPRVNAGSIINNLGYIIESNQDIYVGIRVLGGSSGTSSFPQAGALTSKGISALGKSFKAGMAHMPNTGNGQLQFISVMATLDNTEIIFENLDPAVEYAGTVTSSISSLTINLNRGESYILAASIDDSGTDSSTLIGTSISSNKNIVVNSGSANGTFHNGTQRDFGFDQIAPESRTGKEFIFVRGYGQDGFENILLIATQENTSIFLNGSSTPITTLAANEYYIIEGNQYNSSSISTMYVETSENVFAYQGFGGTSSEANQGMFFVPPLNCAANVSVNNIPEFDKIGTTLMSNSVVYLTTNAGSNILVSDDTNTNVPISSLAGVVSSTVNGNANYEAYRITGLTGNISASSSGELYLSYMNRNASGASGAYYSGFQTELFLLSDNNIKLLENASDQPIGVTLAAAPTSDIYINISNSDPSEVVLDKNALIFTPLNWNVTQTLTLSPQQDTIIDGNQAVDIVFSIDTSLTSDCYHSIPEKILTLEVADVDPTFIVSPTYLLVNESGSVTSSFEITMPRMPSSDVVFSLTYPDVTEISLSTSTITFNPFNWETPQKVIVYGLDDSIRDGDILQSITVSIVDSLSEDSFDFYADQQINVINLDDDPENCFNRSFNAADVIFINDATNPSPGVYALTPDLNNQRGMVWYQNKVDLRVEFIIDVDLNFGTRDSSGADGIAFVIQNINTSQGSSGVGMGYQGINPSFAIEMDTYYNTTPDPTSDHIAFVPNGTTSVAPPPGDIQNTANLEDGNWHNMRIMWQPDTQFLSYIFTHNNGTIYADTKLIDLQGTIVGSNIAYVGFTSATGGSRNLQQVRFDNNSFCIADEILTPTATNNVSGTSLQVICATPSPTLSDLSISGLRPQGVNPRADINGNPYNLVWFDAAIGGNYLPNTTLLVDGATYYVEAANLSDPTATSYRESENRLAVVVDLVFGTFTSTNTLATLTEGSNTSTFSIVLDDQPTGNVVYDLTSTDLTQMTVFPASMTFTPSNWNIVQTGTITTVDDLIADGDQNETFRIELDAAASDDCYDITPVNYVITILDDEVAGYRLSPVAGSLLEGNSQSAQVSVVLTAAPLTNIIIDLQSQDTTEVTLATASLTFTPSNWNTAQTVTLTSVDELLVDGTQTVSITASINGSSDPAFTGLASQTVTVDNADNDIPGFTLSAITGSLTEASTQTASLTIVLNARPVNDVILSITTSPTDEISLSTTSVTFTNANWNATQTLVISALDDFLIDGTIISSITFSVDSTSDASYVSSVTAQRLSVANQDNEVPGFTLSPIYGGPLTEGSASTVSFTVVLDARPDPSEFVIIDIVSLDTTESQVNTTTASLVFTSTNWNISQVVSLTSVEDIILDGTVSSTIEVSVNSTSPSLPFTTLATQTLTVATLDNDIAGFTLSALVGSLTEGATPTITFGVSLNVQPLTPVTIDFSSSDLGEVNLGTTSYLFNPSTWNTTQTVTLQSVDDYFIDGSQTVSITAAVNTSSDPGFTAVASQVVTAINADNDVASITLTPLDNLSSEAGDTASFSVQLSAIPTGNVSLELRSTNPAEALPVSNLVQFTPANWNIPQLILINGINDNPPFSDGSQTVTIVTENVSSTDVNFGAITDVEVADFVLVNQDDDAPGVVINAINNDFTASEAGKTVTLTFELLSQPSADVTIPLSLAGEVDELSLAVSSIVIPAANWNQPQLNQVVITGVDDSIIDGRRTVLFVTGDPTSSDGPYNGLTAANIADVSLYNQDNDNAGLQVNLPGDVSENAATTSFTVALQTSIAATTTILIRVNDNTELFVTSSQLVFTQDNWNVPQTVTVIGVDDNLIDGDISSSILLDVATANCDLFYCGLSSEVIYIINRDNDADTDGDGIFDQADNCPLIENVDQLDFDGDGIGDVCDNDRDGDGVENTQELSDLTDPDDPCSYLFQSITLTRLDLGDCDNDQVPNTLDEDDDNDGILDSDEGFVDSDFDGIPDHLDLDADGDGCPDVLEAGALDDDNDGILGTSPVIVDAQGRVINEGGYQIPIDGDANGIFDFQETSTPLTWVNQPPSMVYFDDVMQASARLNSPTFALYQWQENVGSDSSPIWEDSTDDAVLTGSQTNQISWNNPDASYGGKQYRLMVHHLTLYCQTPLISETLTLGTADIIIPNAFSPDGDGQNDTWEIQGLNASASYRLSVFNRWENKVFETSQYQNDWDGTSNVSSFISSDNKLPEGTYFYLLEWNDGRAPITGFVYIKRRTN